MFRKKKYLNYFKSQILNDVCRTIGCGMK